LVWLNPVQHKFKYFVTETVKYIELVQRNGTTEIRMSSWMNKITEKEKNVLPQNEYKKSQECLRWLQYVPKKSPLSACSDRNKNLVN